MELTCFALDGFVGGNVVRMGNNERPSRWRRSRIAFESHHSQQHAAAGESCSGLQQSKEAIVL
jgi:hypothetical protein